MSTETSTNRPISSRSLTLAVEISAGELIDKISILEIKNRKIVDPRKRSHVQRELASLQETRDRALPASPELKALAAAIAEVNFALWEIEDAIREQERLRDFGPRFIQLVRCVPDQRPAI